MSMRPRWLAGLAAVLVASLLVNAYSLASIRSQRQAEAVRTARMLVSASDALNIVADSVGHGPVNHDDALAYLAMYRQLVHYAGYPLDDRASQFLERLESTLMQGIYELAVGELEQTADLEKLIRLLSQVIRDEAGDRTRPQPSNMFPHTDRYSSIIQRIHDETSEQGLWELLVTLNPRLELFVERPRPGA